MHPCKSCLYNHPYEKQSGSEALSLLSAGPAGNHMCCVSLVTNRATVPQGSRWSLTNFCTNVCL